MPLPDEYPFIDAFQRPGVGCPIPDLDPSIFEWLDREEVGQKLCPHQIDVATMCCIHCGVSKFVICYAPML